MDQYGQYLVALLFRPQILQSTRNTFNHRIDRFQVTGVIDHKHADIPIPGFQIGQISVMVFHVPGTHHTYRIIGVGEFLEYFQIRLLEDIHQHIQASAVRHAQNNIVDTIDYGSLHQRIHHRNQSLSAFQGETSLPRVLLIEHDFKQGGMTESF